MDKILTIVKKPIITFDTNSIIDLNRNNDNDLQQLYKWHKSGHIEIVKTDVADTELQTSSSKSVEFTEDMGDGVIGHSRIGHMKVG